MQCQKFWVAAFLALLPAQSWAADQELCSALRAFRTAPLEKDAEGNPLRRAIEYHFIGSWLGEKGWSRDCVHGGSAPAEALCPVLTKNSNFEFQSILPREILGCYGWKMPADEWYVQRAVFHLSTDERGRNLPENRGYWVTLEIDYRWRKQAHTALRLSIIPTDEKYEKRPPLIDGSKNPVEEGDIEP
jgi:hypothetical protein